MLGTSGKVALKYILRMIYYEEKVSSHTPCCTEFMERIWLWESWWGLFFQKNRMVPFPSDTTMSCLIALSQEVGPSNIQT